MLKTRWLCKKDGKRVLLTLAPTADKSGVQFGIAYPSAEEAKSKTIAATTVSSSGAKCPCCGVITATDDIRQAGKAGKLGLIPTAVVVEGAKGKEYRTAEPEEAEAAQAATKLLSRAFANIALGPPSEPISTGSIRKGGVSITRWGIENWGQLFTTRQLVALGTVASTTRMAFAECVSAGYPAEWCEAIALYLAATMDRLADYASVAVLWGGVRETFAHTFTRFALPMAWDFAEVNPVGETTGGYPSAREWVSRAITHCLDATAHAGAPPKIVCGSAMEILERDVDVILTDPPYYDSVPYADLMDFFYVWLRRALLGLSPRLDASLQTIATPKWDHAKQDGELIDDESRFEGSSVASKKAYEDGMTRAFEACHRALTSSGRLVIVFAHKKPDAWEALVAAMIRSGFVVDGSWPIVTEMRGGVRNFGRASLASSVWLVCKKRPDTARPGWDNRVLEEMRENIHKRLREFWDAGIRGPDFVWAATGPAMEAYSKHPVVKKANEAGQLLTVGEFLRHVRRIVVDFVVGRVLTHDGGADAVAGLDDVTTYYLLHRNDFGMGDAPAGACILYAVSCGVTDRDLTDQLDLLTRTGGKAAEIDHEESEDAEENEEGESPETSGNKVRLKPWEQRRRKGMGFDSEGRPSPLIDQVHRLLQLWRAGDVAKVDDYVEARALRRNPLFHKLLQALIELAPEGSEERALMESVSNHVSPRSQPAEKRQRPLPIGTEA